MSAAGRDQKRLLDWLELELETLMELRIEPGSSARATGALQHLALSLAQSISFNGLQFESGFNIYMPT